MLTSITKTKSPEIEFKDPITGEKRLAVIDRTGYSEGNLITALSNPETPRDRKDFLLSMYLYERGAHGASMVADLMRYKGHHTKETRVFKSQIRFDFETFVDTFAAYLKDQSRLIGLTLGINIGDEIKAYAEWLEMPNNKKGTYKDFNKKDAVTYVALIEMAMRAHEEAGILKENVRRMADARTREKGKGIYVSTAGVPFTIDDPQLDEIIKADREATEGIKNDHD
jgi:hypothetical protein